MSGCVDKNVRTKTADTTNIQNSIDQKEVYFQKGNAKKKSLVVIL